MSRIARHPRNIDVYTVVSKCLSSCFVYTTISAGSKLKAWAESEHVFTRTLDLFVFVGTNKASNTSFPPDFLAVYGPFGDRKQGIVDLVDRETKMSKATTQEVPGASRPRIIPSTPMVHPPLVGNSSFHTMSCPIFPTTTHWRAVKASTLESFRSRSDRPASLLRRCSITVLTRTKLHDTFPI